MEAIIVDYDNMGKRKKTRLLYRIMNILKYALDGDFILLLDDFLRDVIDDDSAHSMHALAIYIELHNDKRNMIQLPTRRHRLRVRKLKLGKGEQRRRVGKFRRYAKRPYSSSPIEYTWQGAGFLSQRLRKIIVDKLDRGYMGADRINIRLESTGHPWLDEAIEISRIHGDLKQFILNPQTNNRFDSQYGPKGVKQMKDWAVHARKLGKKSKVDHLDLMWMMRERDKAISEYMIERFLIGYLALFRGSIEFKLSIKSSQQKKRDEGQVTLTYADLIDAKIIRKDGAFADVLEIQRDDLFPQAVAEYAFYSYAVSQEPVIGGALPKLIKPMHDFIKNEQYVPLRLAVLKLFAELNRKAVHPYLTNVVRKYVKNTASSPIEYTWQGAGFLSQRLRKIIVDKLDRGYMGDERINVKLETTGHPWLDQAIEITRNTWRLKTIYLESANEQPV